MENALGSVFYALASAAVVSVLFHTAWRTGRQDGSVKPDISFGRFVRQLLKES